MVFAIDHLPSSVAGDGGRGALVRRYLEAGGKVVWPGIPPLLRPHDPATGRPAPLKDVAWDAPRRLLGVDHDGAIFDQRGARATAAGRRWGRPERGRVGWGVAPSAVTEVLALDEWGLAAEWVQAYGGPPGTGFVRLGILDDDGIYLAAEYRPAASGR